MIKGEPFALFRSFDVAPRILGFCAKHSTKNPHEGLRKFTLRPPFPVCHRIFSLYEDKFLIREKPTKNSPLSSLLFSSLLLSIGCLYTIHEIMIFNHRLRRLMCLGNEYTSSDVSQCHLLTFFAKSEGQLDIEKVYF